MDKKDIKKLKEKKLKQLRDKKIIKKESNVNRQV